MMPTIILVLFLVILAGTIAVTEGESIRGRNQNAVTNESRNLWGWAVPVWDPWDAWDAWLQAELQAWASILPEVPEIAEEGGEGESGSDGDGDGDGESGNDGESESECEGASGSTRYGCVDGKWVYSP
mmetsp:Transcript_40748/g.45529  ORF Transcript_40748/g.45529 Transcript_40748/m.45529 type:complete len:128 (+) Transcript_40748:91-474(+)